MKLHFARRDRTLPPPAWPFVGLGLVLLAGAGFLLSLIPARFIPPCGFHLATGHPCPSCGVTRMGMLLLRGDLQEAARMSPFFFALLSGLVLWVLVGAVAWAAGRRFTIEVGRREEKWWWIALLLAFFANWWYLWRAGI